MNALQLASFCRSLKMRSKSQHVLVVEKDAVFRALCDAKLWKMAPLILVTAQGMPDIATRAFLKQANSQLPCQLTFHGLVDWNPSGILILANYKCGPTKHCAEANQCVPCDHSRFYNKWSFRHTAVVQQMPNRACVSQMV
jgi:DNA topoisomerase VI subunit A